MDDMEYTIGAIARELGVSNGGVMYWMHKLEIKPRNITFGSRKVRLLDRRQRSLIRENIGGGRLQRKLL